MNRILTLFVLTALMGTSAFADDCAKVYQQRAKVLSIGAFGGVPVGAAAGFGVSAGVVAGSAAASSAAILYPPFAGVLVAAGGPFFRAMRLDGLAQAIAYVQNPEGVSEKVRDKGERVVSKLARKVSRILDRKVSFEEVATVLRETNAAGTLCTNGKVMGYPRMKRFIAHYLTDLDPSSSSDEFVIDESVDASDEE